MKKTILLTAFSIACFYNMVYGQSENKKEAIEAEVRKPDILPAAAD